MRVIGGYLQSSWGSQLKFSCGQHYGRTTFNFQSCWWKELYIERIIYKNNDILDSIDISYIDEIANHMLFNSLYYSIINVSLTYH